MLDFRKTCSLFPFRRFPGALKFFPALVLYFLFGGSPFNQLGHASQPLNISNRMLPDFRYEVTVPPPDRPIKVADNDSALPAEERERFRNVFESREFSKLNEEFSILQALIEKDPSREALLFSALGILDNQPHCEELLDQWVKQFPSHFAPHLALGIFYVQRGWESRGGNYARDTSEEQFRGMRNFFVKARTELEQALQLNPRLLPAYVDLITIYMAQGDGRRAEAVFNQARALFPLSNSLYRKVMSFRAPRWGGSYPEMEALAKEASGKDATNSDLYGLIYSDQALRFLEGEQPDKAAEYYGKALAYGESSRVYDERGLVYLYKLKNLQAAFADFNRCINLFPGYAPAYRHRAQVYLQVQQLDNALEDIRMAKRLERNHREMAQWCQAALTQIGRDEKGERIRIELKAIAREYKDSITKKTSPYSQLKSSSLLKISKKFQAPPGTQPSGLEWQDKFLFMSSYALKPGLYRINPDDGKVEFFSAPNIVWNNRYGGLASDGLSLYHVQANNSTKFVKLTDTFLVDTENYFGCIDVNISDLAIHNSSIYAVGTGDSFDSNDYTLYKFSLTGSVQEAFQFHYGGKTAQNFGLASDGVSLWVSAGSRLLKIDPANGSTLDAYELPLERIGCLAWDGNKLWAASFKGDVYTISVQ